MISFTPPAGAKRTSIGDYQKARAKLGSPSNIAAAGVCGRQIQIAAADQFASGPMPIIEAIRRTGATTLEAITRALNERGIRPARGTLVRFVGGQSSRPREQAR